MEGNKPSDKKKDKNTNSEPLDKLIEKMQRERNALEKLLKELSKRIRIFLG